METYFLVGTYSEPILFGTGEVVQGKGEGIYLCALDEEGRISVRACLKLRNPSFLEIDDRRKHIYAVNEMKEFDGAYGGGLTDIVFDDDMNMTVLGSFETCGADPCHVAASPDGRFVCTANFADGRVSVFPLDESGRVLPGKTVYAHSGHSIDPKRQRGPHAHSILFPGDDRMFVPDLGLDMLKAYRITGEGIVPDEENSLALAVGSGPRAGVWTKDGRHLYVIHELDSSITHIVREEAPGEEGGAPEGAPDGTLSEACGGAPDAASGGTSGRKGTAGGKLRIAQRIDTIPEERRAENDCADLHLTPDERYLYASNRGTDTIALFRVGQDGSLTAAGWTDCGGKTPRSFAIDPSGRYLLAGCQDSDRITVFAIGEDGSLDPVSQAEVPTPVCIRFV